MRTFARHLAGVIVGAIGATIVVFLTGLGIPEEEVVTFLEAFQEVLVMAILVAGYFLTEKGLKLVKGLFPDAWADHIWKDHAGDVVKNMSKDAAEDAIRTGKV